MRTRQTPERVAATPRDRELLDGICRRARWYLHTNMTSIYRIHLHIPSAAVLISCDRTVVTRHLVFFITGLGDLCAE